MEQLAEYYPDDSGGDSTQHRQSEFSSEQTLGDDPVALQAAVRLFELAARNSRSDEELARLEALAKTDKQAFFAELGTTPEEAAYLFHVLGFPDFEAGPAIDPDEAHGWMRLAGREPTEDNIRLHGETVDAFARYVIGDDEEASRVLKADAYDVDRFANVMDELANAAEEEDDSQEFDKLSAFVNLSRTIFPRQFVDLVDALSKARHPVVRGTTAFSLHYALERDRKRAISIWQRLLEDKEPRVLDAAVMNYHFLTREGSIPTEHGRVPTEDTMNRRDRRALRKYVAAAQRRMREAGYAGSVDWGNQ